MKGRYLKMETKSMRFCKKIPCPSLCPTVLQIGSDCVRAGLFYCVRSIWTKSIVYYKSIFAFPLLIFHSHHFTDSSLFVLLNRAKGRVWLHVNQCWTLKSDIILPLLLNFFSSSSSASSQRWGIHADKKLIYFGGQVVFQSKHTFSFANLSLIPIL